MDSSEQSLPGNSFEDEADSALALIEDVFMDETNADGISDKDFEREVDPTLALVVDLLNEDTNPDSEQRIGMTLLVAGQRVEGDAIPRYAWLREWAEKLKPGAPALAKGYEQGWRKVFDEGEAIRKRRREEGLENPLPLWIHVRDHRVPGLLWRIRLDRVDGWSWGYTS